MSSPSQPASSALYRIASRALLPLEMHGSFGFPKAYDLCCQWNQEHCVRDMAWPEPAAPPLSPNNDLVLHVQVAAREYRTGIISQSEMEDTLR